MYFRRSGRSGLSAVALTVLLAACSRPAPPEPAAPEASPAPPSAPAAVIPAPPPPLGRAALLDAVALAADAASAGRPYPEAAAALAGRSFRLKLPFGCTGASTGEAGLGYEWNPEGRILKLSAAPETWSDTALRTQIGDEATESLEGFWLRRPWLRTEDCPAAVPGDDLSGPPAPETLGLVSVFGRDDSRIQKRSRRPYEITRKLKEGEAPSPNGYRLVLEGRVGGGEDQPPVICRSNGPDRPPLCFVRVNVDRVAFETPAGDQLAEWIS